MKSQSTEARTTARAVCPLYRSLPTSKSMPCTRLTALGGNPASANDLRAADNNPSFCALRSGHNTKARTSVRPCSLTARQSRLRSARLSASRFLRQRRESGPWASRVCRSQHEYALLGLVQLEKQILHAQQWKTNRFAKLHEGMPTGSSNLNNNNAWELPMSKKS